LAPDETFLSGLQMVSDVSPCGALSYHFFPSHLFFLHLLFP
jgi:hypothetical protein